MVTVSPTMWHTLSSSMKQCEANSERMMFGCSAFLSRTTVQLPSANTAQTIGKLSAKSQGKLQPDSPTITRLYISQ